MNAGILFHELSVVGVFGLRRVRFYVSWAYDIWLCSFKLLNILFKFTKLWSDQLCCMVQIPGQQRGARSRTRSK